MTRSCLEAPKISKRNMHHTKDYVITVTQHLHPEIKINKFMVNGLNPGVSVIYLVWSSGWGKSLERLLLVTDVWTTWAVVIFRVKWRVIVRWWYLCLWSWFGLVSKFTSFYSVPAMYHKMMTRKLVDLWGMHVIMYSLLPWLYSTASTNTESDLISLSLPHCLWACQ